MIADLRPEQLWTNKRRTPRGAIPLGVIGLPADDFKVRHRFCCDVINGRQDRHLPLMSSTPLLASLIAVSTQQLWIELGTVVGVKTAAAMKCLIDDFYCLLDGVLATTPLIALSDCHSLPLDQFAVVPIAEPNLGRSTPTHANTSHPLPPW